jgi:hypothetical protein
MLGRGDCPSLTPESNAPRNDSLMRKKKKDNTLCGRGEGVKVRLQMAAYCLHACFKFAKTYTATIQVWAHGKQEQR